MNLGDCKHLWRGQLLKLSVGNEVEVHIHEEGGQVAHSTEQLEDVLCTRHNVILLLVKVLDAI